MEMMREDEFVALVETLCDEQGLNQSALASALGVSRQYVSAVLTGKEPGHVLKARIAAYFGLVYAHDPAPPIEKEGLGERLEAQRMQRGWSQRELVERLNAHTGLTLTKATISHYETGHVLPSDERIEQLARALEIESSVLLEVPDAEDSHAV